MRQREGKGEIAMGLRSRLSRQIVFGGGCTFPSDIPSGQGEEVESLCVCVSSCTGLMLMSYT